MTATTSWQEDAICNQTDPEAFFPEKGGSVRDAKTICSLCPVQAECLDYALATDQRYGVWGGVTERNLRVLRRERRDAAVTAMIENAKD